MDAQRYDAKYIAWQLSLVYAAEPHSSRSRICEVCFQNRGHEDIQQPRASRRSSLRQCPRNSSPQITTRCRHPLPLYWPFRPHWRLGRSYSQGQRQRLPSPGRAACSQACLVTAQQQCQRAVSRIYSQRCQHSLPDALWSQWRTVCALGQGQERLVLHSRWSDSFVGVFPRVNIEHI